jgi:hypothetical protein
MALDLMSNYYLVKKTDDKNSCMAWRDFSMALQAACIVQTSEAACIMQPGDKDILPVYC